MTFEGSRSPFDRFERTFDESDLRCSRCGAVDPNGDWRVTAADGRVRYQHVCPECDAVETRELRLDRSASRVGGETNRR